jgi:hypothetical protein
MNMTAIFDGIGRFFQWTFTFITGFGNKPNIFFWLVIVSLLITWLRMQVKFNKKAKENSTLP